jgi:LacI family transcriptional regulator
MTIDEIAKQLGVSKTTVSRVINGKPDVSPETRKQIQDLINATGYQPNANAKAITQQKSSNIGLIIPFAAEYVFANPFYVEVMRGISTELDQKCYYLVLCYPHEQNYLDIYTQKRVDGFILLSPSITMHPLIDILIEKNVAFTSTARVGGHEDIPFVDVDNYLGGISAVEHLVSLGHREIAFIGKKGIASSSDRYQGYRDTLKRHNIPEQEELVFSADSSTLDSGYETAKQMISKGHIPTAIFAASDLMALGVMRALLEVGMKVPDDISIIGFDNIRVSQYSYPTLSTITQPAFEKGVIAADMLVNHLNTKERPESVILSTELVIRESTGAVKK